MKMKMKMKMNSLVACLLVALAGVGCVRTTSLGRATGATDAQVDADASSSDAPGNRDGGTPADRDPTPTLDAPADMPREAPIVGTGRDANSDAPDGSDADAF